jgi:hypothetical protein
MLVISAETGITLWVGGVGAAALALNECGAGGSVVVEGVSGMLFGATTECVGSLP